MFSKLRPIVFWPATICMLGTIIASLIANDNFTIIVNACNGFVSTGFSWLLSLTGVVMAGICFYAFAGRIGDIVIGGPGAKKELTPFKWFAVSLTTVIAIGLAFWPVAEAIMHYSSPPPFTGVQPGEPAALTSTMATIYTHWLFIPYGIYGVIAITFALAFYNLRMPFSLFTIVRPLFGKYADNKYLPEIIDFIGCFAVIVGMSATLVSGIMALAGGMEETFGTGKSTTLYAIMAFALIGAAILSAASGLQKGIQWLARINTWLYFIGLAFIFLFGPSSFILRLGVESFGVYLDEFFTRNLIQTAAYESNWASYWTVAWFGSWFAWAPITCLFLARIGKGYTIRQFVLVNFFLPALFGWLWFSIISGTALFVEVNNGNLLSTALKETSFENLIYVLLDQFPLGIVTKTLLMFVIAISFITAANANLVTIGGLCSKGISQEHLDSPTWLKIFWGAILACTAWLGTSLMGLDAIRALFNLAGFIGLIVAIGAIGAFFKVKNIVLRGQNIPANAVTSEQAVSENNVTA